LAKELKADVLIIGGGVAGAAIARELSQYNVDTLLIEKKPDVSMGISKTSHGFIYTGAEMVYSKVIKSRGMGHGPKFDDHHTETLVEGFPIAHELMHDLDVPHGHGGAIYIARSTEEIPLLEELEEHAKELHAFDSSAVKIIDRDSLFKIEPNITREAIAALYDPKCILDVFPQEFVFALAENARNNGVRMLLETEALGFSSCNGDQIVETNKGNINTKFIINAAGMSADKVADLAGAHDDWDFSFTQHQITLYDKRLNGLINNHVRDIPQGGLLNLVSPMREGNLCSSCGPKEVVTDRWNTTTNKESFNLIARGAKDLVPSISAGDIITTFVGITLANTREDNIVESSKRNPRFVNAVLKLPGFVAAPLIAKRAVALLADQGLQLAMKSSFNPVRKGIPKFSELSDEEREKLISEDPRYEHIICRCETVTEGEIVEAIRRGATTVQGVQFRTRAGMGRCQSGFCGPRLVGILSRELGIPATEVTKKGGVSRILLYQLKEILRGA